MPGLDGLDATRRILSQSQHDVAILMLTTFDLNEYVYEAMRAGASGFLLKDVAPEQLVAAVRIVAAGDALIAPAITKRLIRQFAKMAPPPIPGGPLSVLTPREHEVLALNRTRTLKRGDRRGARGQRSHRQNTRDADPRQARAPRPRPAVVLAYETGLLQPGSD